jgi:D-glycerate 3-kinase
VSDVIQALLDQLIAQKRAAKPDRIPLIGVAGAQGSGKSYQCRRYVAAHPRVAHFSLDDVYFSKVERVELSQRVHPLFATRGPPGTHDLTLAERTFAALRTAGPSAQTPLPRFDKAADDRAPARVWPTFSGRPAAILFDGWCLGALPDALGETPLNALEAHEDAEGRWRAAVRANMSEPYAHFFSTFDAILYLKPPTWEIVKRWRTEQEAETLGRALTDADHLRLDRFLMHYERITKSMMAGAHRATHCVQLSENRLVAQT